MGRMVSRQVLNEGARGTSLLDPQRTSGVPNDESSRQLAVRKPENEHSSSGFEQPF